MFSAITMRIPAIISAYGLCSRDEPLPRRLPDTEATKPPFFTLPCLIGNSLARLQPQVGKLAERLVEVVADVGGRDLVGGDVVAQPLAKLGSELDVLALQLPAHQVRVVQEEEDPALEAYLRGELLDRA